MNAAVLFLATFGVVFFLGIQQLNVDGNHRWFAFFTSPLIALSNLVLFKVLPGPTGLLEILGYVAGGAFGIVASMELHPRLLALRTRFQSQREPGERGEDSEAVDVACLALELADEVARSDIETNCACTRMGHLDWYDLGTAHEAFVRRAEVYLSARQLLIRHPMRFTLVRFPLKGAAA